MKKILLFIFVLYSIVLQGQNLVPNPSFENPRNKRPSMQPWQMINTIDYFVYDESKKGQIVRSKIKDKNFKLRPARTGKAYVGLRVWPDYHEFLIVELLQELEANRQYYFEMYIALSPHANSYLRSFGVSFYNFKPPYAQKNSIYDFPPQIRIFQHSGLGNTEDWVKVSGVFTAKGGERFMTIGNFSRNNNDKFKRRKFGLNKREAYYYIDDVALYIMDDRGFPVIEADETVTELQDEVSYYQYDPNIRREVEDYYRLIHFPTGSSELTYEAYQKLAYIIDFMNRKNDVNILIVGYAGISDSSEPEMQSLIAQRRAWSIAIFITGNKIHKNRLTLSFNTANCSENGQNSGNFIFCNSAEILFYNEPYDSQRIKSGAFNIFQ